MLTEARVAELLCAIPGYTSLEPAWPWLRDFEATLSVDEYREALAAWREREQLADLLSKEIERINVPCAEAIGQMWAAIILAVKPNYGDWEYAAQAARHIEAEVADIRSALSAAHARIAELEAELKRIDDAPPTYWPLTGEPQ